MLDFIYTVFIAPLEYWMHAALVWSHGQCGHWGWAIVAMSLVVNTVILPIYVLAERWQQEEQRIRLGFQDKESMFDRVFKGQEKFAMVSTMRRQAGYTAILSMRSSLGFFLQIPFFFAAYHFLSHYGALSGVSFLGLPDLSQPDGLLVLGSLHINVMPWIMTFINLASALIYTQNLTRRDKIQLYAVALIFLVLLYDAASGLVLYWTCNNIYSLAKNIVYAQMDRFGISADTFALRLREASQSILPTRFPHWPLYAWLTLAILGVLGSKQALFVPVPCRELLCTVANAGFLLLVCMSVIDILRAKLYRSHWMKCLILLVLAYFACKIWYRGTFVTFSKYAPTLVLSLIAFASTMFAWELRSGFFRRIFKKGSLADLYCPSCVWIVLLLFGYLPVHVFCTSPESFSAPDTVLAWLLFYMALGGIAFFALGWLFRLFCHEDCAALSITCIAVILSVYALLLPIQAGHVDGMQLTEPAALLSPFNLAVDIPVLIALLALLWWTVSHGYVRFLKSLFTILCVGSLCMGLTDLWSVRTKFSESSFQGADALPATLEQELGFTKTGKNAIVVVLDMFSGALLPPILEDHPELRQVYRDFTWYPDALAPGGNTVASLATIIGGAACTPQGLNADPSKTLVEKVNQAYADTINRFSPTAEVYFNERTWLDTKAMSCRLKGPSILVRQASMGYLHYYNKTRRKHWNLEGSDDFLVSVAMYSVLPWSVKHYIYNGGNWIGLSSRGYNNQMMMKSARDWSLFETLPELANANRKADTFKVFYSEMTHRPWFMQNGVCDFCEKRTSSVSGCIEDSAYYTVQTCALLSLGKWFDWMRANGVYENTTIVIASDHGTSRWNQNPLVLVKPAAAKNETMAVSDARISLTDVPALLLGESIDTSKDRVRYHYSNEGRSESQFIGVVEHAWKGPAIPLRAGQGKGNYGGCRIGHYGIAPKHQSLLSIHP